MITAVEVVIILMDLLWESGTSLYNGTIVPNLSANPNGDRSAICKFMVIQFLWMTILR